MMGSALALAELHVSPFSQDVEDRLNSLPDLLCINCSCQSSIICKRAEDALCPLSQVTIKKSFKSVCSSVKPW